MAVGCHYGSLATGAGGAGDPEAEPGFGEGLLSHGVWHSSQAQPTSLGYSQEYPRSGCLPATLGFLPEGLHQAQVTDFSKLGVGRELRMWGTGYYTHCGEAPILQPACQPNICEGISG